MKKLLMMTLKLHKNLFKTAVTSLDIHGNQYTVEKVENIVMLLIKQKKKSWISSKHFTYQKNIIGKNISSNLFCFNEITTTEVLN